jgi:Fe2+ or Zn2+ uptake regulation protein
VGRASWSVQRGLSEIFEAEDGPLSTLELAARLYQVEPRELTEARLSSVRRALNALARKGVLVGHRDYNGRIARWATRAGWNAERAARWRG